VILVGIVYDLTHCHAMPCSDIVPDLTSIPMQRKSNHRLPERHAPFSDSRLVRNRNHCLGLVVLHGDRSGIAGQSSDSLDLNCDTVRLGLLLQLGVFLYALDEVLARS